MMFDIDIETLAKSLHGTTPVAFSFFKKDGSRRNAIGTLNEKLIPEESKTLKSKDPSANNGDNLKYYDLEKKAWRSLSKGCSLVTILE
jgi:hypothetical protein